MTWYFTDREEYVGNLKGIGHVYSDVSAGISGHGGGAGRRAGGGAGEDRNPGYRRHSCLR